MTDKAVKESGPEGFRVLTNFTPDEFESVWSIVESTLTCRQNDGRELVLKHYQTWDKHALDFGMKAPTLEKMVMRVIYTVQPILCDHFVTMPTMTDLRGKDAVFRNYPYTNLPIVQRVASEKEKLYFSGKHKFYGVKIEASVSPEGFLVDMSAHEPGSVSDITMFGDRHDVHLSALRKLENETKINDNGGLFQDIPDSRAVLVDKGYVGLTGSTRAIHPKKRPVNGVLDRADLERNTNVSSDRVIVENFFGRVCLLWKVSYSTFVWGTKCYDVIQRLTFALTNFHLALMPLRL
ncbi:hypothetical protein H257_11648 [Aphanomyces astaci]|uniref:DDE Tnp4 domain-containing protein n=1 Tax=Aphanomyces astaci TaxID=112090 RepID=W4G398_APHAT|nr:hypothetical protein H257_11648 [Aphanomyces astaci]ETV73524.1 hypothetical protein H257_11648 [Aphanomyces astaci]|eukprot:XP_009836950.1 hypothetical protein H257_11648 [Aphanomyces astaci]